MNENDFNDNFSDNFKDAYGDDHEIIEEFVSAQEGEDDWGEEQESPDTTSAEMDAIEVHRFDEEPRHIAVEEPEEHHHFNHAKHMEHAEHHAKDHADKPKRHGRGKVAAGFLGGLIGLLIGGVGVYVALTLMGASSDNCADNCAVQPEDDPVKTPSTSALDDTFDFLRLETAGQNLIYSPLSINSALSLLSLGADGDTREEIESVLGTTQIPQYANIPDKLSLANAVFIRNDFRDYVLDSYITAATSNNNADIIFDNFESADVFNTWASDKTFGLINNLGIVPNGLTEMVLANALAIQMDWTHPFDSVYDDTFHLANDEEVIVPTLHEDFATSDITYSLNSDATVLTLPLDSTSEEVNLDFVAIVPSSDLGVYASNFTTDDLDKLLASTVPSDSTAGGIAVSIPKFKFDYELDFKNDLKTLGIKSAFTDQANFSNLASTPLFIGAAIHKATIDFSETGIRAAAVTSFAMETTALLDETPEPIPVVIDRPFLFVIRDRDNGAIWFTGTVYNPSL